MSLVHSLLNQDFQRRPEQLRHFQDDLIDFVKVKWRRHNRALCLVCEKEWFKWKCFVCIKKKKLVGEYSLLRLESLQHLTIYKIPPTHSLQQPIPSVELQDSLSVSGHQYLMVLLISRMTKAQSWQQKTITSLFFLKGNSKSQISYWFCF
jgi:hypothetical protein